VVHRSSHMSYAFQPDLASILRTTNPADCYAASHQDRLLTTAFDDMSLPGTPGTVPGSMTHFPGEDASSSRTAELQPPFPSEKTPALDVETITVTDPLSRKLQVPTSAVRPTLATSRPGIPSLCLLYLDGKCRQGTQCHQVHAEPSVVLTLRSDAKKLPTCCYSHGDVGSGCLRQQWLDRALDIDGVVVRVRQMAYTLALDKLLSDTAEDPSAVVKAQIHQICRLHASQRCRFAEDCRFLHICREVMRQQFSASVPDLVPPLELRHATPGGSRPMKPNGKQAPPPAFYAPQAPQFVLLPDGTLAQMMPMMQQPPQMMHPHAMMAAPAGGMFMPMMQQGSPMAVMGGNQGVPVMMMQPGQQFLFAPPTVQQDHSVQYMQAAPSYPHNQYS
jgi:hypothetical protein